MKECIGQQRTNASQLLERLDQLQCDQVGLLGYWVTGSTVRLAMVWSVVQ